jgi:ergothioneine biosynthesis protein EgtB
MAGVSGATSGNGTSVVATSAASIAADDIRLQAIEWYRRNRERTAALFALLSPEAYYERPIALRHPVVFYEGHIPAFSLNTLVKKALGRPGVDPALERLFARGIDPDEGTPERGRITAWPERSDVRAFVDAADRLVLNALEGAPLDVPAHPHLHRSQAVYTVLEHEAMHHETMLYMWHRLPYEWKRAPAGYRPQVESVARPNEDRLVPAGRARVGTAPDGITFGWDNEFGPLEVDVPAFYMDRRNVTNAEFAEFVEAGGYSREDYWAPEDWAWVSSEQITHPAFWEREGGRLWWRGLFERLALPESWPVFVSQAEASAFARWRGCRLATEAEYERAAYGSPDGRPRAYLWGDDAPTARHGAFDFATWDPTPVDTHQAGRSAWGIDDLVGNGWEWTSSVFGPFPGFVASPSYPEYSADFFDDSHYVMKGASTATARELLRPTFRNWFRPRYPYVYASFRCVRSAS